MPNIAISVAETIYVVLPGPPYYRKKFIVQATVLRFCGKIFVGIARVKRCLHYGENRSKLRFFTNAKYYSKTSFLVQIKFITED